MKTPVYKMEIIVLDFEQYGLNSAIEALENNRHYVVKCVTAEAKDAGEWDDDHPLNKRTTDDLQYFKNLPSLSS